MAITLLDLRDQVKALLNNDTDFFTDVNLDYHINASYYKHLDVLSNVLQDRLAIIDFIDTTAGVQSYNLNLVKTSGRIPSQVTDAKYLGSDISSVSYLNLKAQSQMNTDDMTTRGIPQSYTIIGKEIVLGIPPNKTLTDGLKITFVPYPETLTDDADEIEEDFLGTGQNCLVYFAVMACKAQEGLWDPGTFAAQSFASLYEKHLYDFKESMALRMYEEDEIESFINDDVNY